MSYGALGIILETNKLTEAKASMELCDRLCLVGLPYFTLSTISRERLRATYLHGYILLTSNGNQRAAAGK